MSKIYEKCPVVESTHYELRLVKMEDAEDLLEVYSDKKAVPFFNSDNCHGDRFYYSTLERMKEAVSFWLFSYQKKYFVRLALVDKKLNKAIGTIELFRRDAKDFFDHVGLLRLDLRSDHEKEEVIKELMDLMLSYSYEWFECDKIATKAVPSAKERIKAFKACGFELRPEKLVGEDGTEYGDYWMVTKS